jgi:hypothetical protein
VPKAKPIKTNKQRSAKSRSLSSSAASSTSPKPAKQRKTRKPVLVTKKLVTIPLGKGARLTITINRPKPKKKVVKKTVKKTATKKPSKLLTIAILAAGFMGTAFFGLRVLAAPAPPLATPVKNTQKVTQPAPVQKSLPRSVPARLRIPDIELSTDLITVGLMADGTLEVPTNFLNAGWYSGSPTPGEIGPAIIDGHLDNIRGLAVFWRLHEVVPGQSIEIDRQDGATAHFVVTDVKQFPQNDFPTEAVYGNTKTASLRLITCGGTFNRLTGHYDLNTIVFAALQ